MARELTTPKPSNGSLHPTQQMDTIGDIADGHLFHGLVGIKALPHMPADSAMQLANPVGGARKLQGQYGHTEGLLGVLWIHPPELHNLLERRGHLPTKPLHRVIHQVRTETVMPGLNRSMRSENAGSPCFG